MLNKNTLPNLLALALILVSFWLPGRAHDIALTTGLFALSGALTNWLAVHMLFERVPGLYGSGVIPLHFETFKQGIMELVTRQLFRPENVEAAFQDDQGTSLDLGQVITRLDLDVAYDQLVDVIMNSSFGAMLGMVGGVQALEPMREPFKKRMNKFLADTADSPQVRAALAQQVSDMASSERFMEKIHAIVQSRLDQLTPEMVKDIVQDMIRRHLGWLVVWGGVFGGLIGLLSALVLH